VTTTIPRQAAGPVQVLLIDDDDLSREVLTLLLSGEEYEIAAADSGESAVQRLRESPHVPPQVILTDLQMPGISGSELAVQLRAAFPPGTTLLAMSGSQPKGEAARAYDGFLLKPFTRQQFAAAVAGTAHQQAAPTVTAGILDESVFLRFRGSAPISQALEMYAFCLRDAENRLASMREAASRGDDETYRKAAHAIKGSCGMLGATELHRLAGAMEDEGLAAANHVASCDEFILACDRLQRILIARETGLAGSNTSDLSGEGAQ
jgi:CheY-like chemotaxis protein/HPt (histidine-containing phosphotransfer) domain-containing protein